MDIHVLFQKFGRLHFSALERIDFQLVYQGRVLVEAEVVEGSVVFQDLIVKALHHVPHVRLPFDVQLHHILGPEPIWFPRSIRLHPLVELVRRLRLNSILDSLLLFGLYFLIHMDEIEGEIVLLLQVVPA